MEDRMREDLTVDQLKQLAKTLVHQLSAEAQAEILKNCIAVCPMSA